MPRQRHDAWFQCTLPFDPWGLGIATEPSSLASATGDRHGIAREHSASGIALCSTDRDLDLAEIHHGLRDLR